MATASSMNGTLPATRLALSRKLPSTSRISLSRARRSSSLSSFSFWPRTFGKLGQSAVLCPSSRQIGHRIYMFSLEDCGLHALPPIPSLQQIDQCRHYAPVLTCTSYCSPDETVLAT